MSRVVRSLWVAGGLFVVVGCAPQPQAGRQASRLGAPAAARAVPRAYHGAVATAMDEARDVPRFLRATTRQPAPAGATAEVAARAHLTRHADSWRVEAADIAAAELKAVHDPGRGGVIVTFGQRAGGVEVYRGEIKVLMRRDLELVAITGTPLPAPFAPAAFGRTPAAAVAAALGAHLHAAVAPADLASLGAAPGGYERLDLLRPVPVAGGAVQLARPARVKPVLYAGRGGMRPAHFVEVWPTRAGSRAAAAFRYLVADDDGRVLERRDLTADAHSYRVFVDATGRPLDGPQTDFTPHPTGTPDGSYPSFVAPILVTQGGFNHNPDGVADPWLLDSATDARGNNCDAYADLQAPDGFSGGDLRATVTAPGTFDRVYDTSLAPTASQDQSMAAITQLFYMVNWLHDWYYDSGFDEVAGNAQADNYGRGGWANDRIFAEAQDYSEMNNSNMSTPADGDPPKMQILLWSGPEQRTLHVTPSDQDLANGAAEFGPSDFDVTGSVVLVNDGTAPTTNACEAIVNNVSGKIALLDRGTCTFKQKAVYAQAAGAIGVILANNQGSGPVDMPDGTPSTAVTIPMLSVSQADGASLKTALQAGAVTAHLTRHSGVAREGALENTVVAHEWGHYLHERLADCGQNMCMGMSEGWGDFIALHMLLREGDDLDGTYAMAIYAWGGVGIDPGYFGIRRAPYSVQLTRNGLTYGCIADDTQIPNTFPQADQGGGANSEVHNTGEVWAMMLFEAYVALQKQSRQAGTRTFDEMRRVMSDYVVGSLKASPADATLLEARDALLAVAGAASEDDQTVIAEAFARRGAGTCAVSPPRDSPDNNGVVESFVVKPRVVLGAPTLDDSLSSCDQNGRLDSGERGQLTVEVTNASIVPLGGATVTVSSALPVVTFPAGASVAVGALAPFASTTVSVEVALDASLRDMEILRFDVTASSDEACEAGVTRAAAFRTNYREQEAAAASDDVEASTSVWTPAGDVPEEAWARAEVEPGSHVWHGADLGHNSDTWLESPPLTVSASGRFVVSFRHRYQFEASDDGTGLTYYDAAVIELTTDGGATWTDVSSWVDPGYGGVVTDISQDDPNTQPNPLANRMAFVDANAAWPDMESVRLDFGGTFAGQTVSLRFRIGTDPAASAAGWDLDDLGFQGIEGTPFSAVVYAASACPAPAQDDGGTAGDGGADDDGGTGPGGRGVATCGGCAAGQSPRGAALLGALAAAGLLLARRRR
jgi:large repetitive protein